MTQRCPWVPVGDPLYISYHDEEWGAPVHDDRRLFEMLTLEGAQAGLSWSTILKRRDGYRHAFDDFDPRKVSAYDEEKILSLLSDERIIRNRMKVQSAVNNARAFVQVQQEFGTFDTYIWQFVGGKPKVNCPTTLASIPAETTDRLLRVHAGMWARGRPHGGLLQGALPRRVADYSNPRLSARTGMVRTP